eukprot:111272-Ditylum_brightwellii.AAC.1
MSNAIKEWDDTGTNMSERDLSFLIKPEFVKFVSFDYDFRKAVHKIILKLALKKCLLSAGAGAGADTVSAVLKCIVPSYK